MQLCGFEVGLRQPFFLIAGPCAIETEKLALESAAELKRIQALYDAPVGDLAAARKRLAADIRARKFEPGTPREVRLLDALTATTATRLRAVNIKYMVRRGRGAESAV